MIPGISIRRIIGALLASIILFVPIGPWLLRMLIPAEPVTPPLPPSIASIQSLSDLAVKAVHIETDLVGHNALYTGKWWVHGEVIVAVDLSKAVYVRTDPERRLATLRLPKPHLLNPRVDLQRTEEKYVRPIGWVTLGSPQSLREEFGKMAEWKIAELGNDPSYRKEGKIQAETVLRNLFGAAGWVVSFEWEGDTPPTASAAN